MPPKLFMCVKEFRPANPPSNGTEDGTNADVVPNMVNMDEIDLKAMALCCCFLGIAPVQNY